MQPQLTEAECHIQWSVTLAFIRSDHDMLPVRQPATIWINAGLLLIGPSGPNQPQTSIVTFMKLLLRGMECTGMCHFSFFA